eukprot:6194116-Pleurochrysis_carterae.AAC.4
MARGAAHEAVGAWSRELEIRVDAAAFIDGGRQRRLAGGIRPAGSALQQLLLPPLSPVLQPSTPPMHPCPARMRLRLLRLQWTAMLLTRDNMNPSQLTKYHISALPAPFLQSRMHAT